MAAATPTNIAAATARTIVMGSIKKTGKKPLGMTSWNAPTAGNVIRSPMTPPRAAMRSDSPAIRPRRWDPENPSVLRTAYSRVRSRDDMIIVLPRTSMMMPMITKEMKFMA